MDAAQGLEAQTLANFHLARDAGLAIVPALNKIDLPAAEPDQRAKELADLLDRDADDIRISAKTGEGVEDLLKSVIAHVPAPAGDLGRAAGPSCSTRCSTLPRGDHLRPREGELPERLEDPADGDRHRVRRRGGRVKAPNPSRSTRSVPVRSGTRHRLKDVHQAKVGDTITIAGKPPRSHSPATGSRSRWCGRACSPTKAATTPSCARRSTGSSCRTPRSATSPRPQALGFGFRAGFLGLLHMDIVKERLEREFDLELIATAPNVEFHVIKARRSRSSTTRPRCPCRGRTTGSRSPSCSRR